MKHKIILLFLILIISTSKISAKKINFNAIKNKINFKKLKNSTLKSYPTKKGTILVTPDFYKKILPIGHAAIIINKSYVYEATSKGIVRGLNNWASIKKRTFGIQVKNSNKKIDSKIINYVKKQIGKKYNFNFLNSKTRKKFYCSQLIWSAFYDSYKINLDTKLFGLAGKGFGAIHPLELVLSKQTKTIFYYAKN